MIERRGGPSNKELLQSRESVEVPDHSACTSRPGIGILVAQQNSKVVGKHPYDVAGCDSSGLVRLASCRLGSTCEGLLNYGHELLCIDGLVESELRAHRLGDLELARSGA